MMSSPGAQDTSSCLPSNLPDPDAPQSGWERLRQMYHVGDQEISEELEYMTRAGMVSMIVGFTYGGIPAARFSRNNYIRASQAEVYTHRIEAVRAAQNAAIRGFIRYGLRWGWRVCAFTTIYNCVHLSMSAYRDKSSLSHYVAAGAISGSLVRLNMGMKGMIAGSVIGVTLGLPLGMLFSGIQALMGMDHIESRRQRRRQQYEQKLQEWTEQLNVTDVLLENMQNVDKTPTERELEKINALLKQPRNP